MPIPDKAKLYTPEEAAEMLSVDLNTLEELRKTKNPALLRWNFLPGIGIRYFGCDLWAAVQPQTWAVTE